MLLFVLFNSQLNDNFNIHALPIATMPTTINAVSSSCRIFTINWLGFTAVKQSPPSFFFHSMNKP